MTDHIRRIKQLDAEIAKLQKIASRGDHVAAGLTISLHVGAQSDERDTDLPDLQLTHDTQQLLDLMIESLKKSRATQESLARKDMRDLQDFFAEQQPK